MWSIFFTSYTQWPCATSYEFFGSWNHTRAVTICYGNQMCIGKCRPSAECAMTYQCDWVCMWQLATNRLNSTTAKKSTDTFWWGPGLQNLPLDELHLPSLFRLDFLRYGLHLFIEDTLLQFQLIQLIILCRIVGSLLGETSHISNRGRLPQLPPLAIWKTGDKVTIICLTTKGQPADIWIGINAQVDHLPNEEKTHYWIETGFKSATSSISTSKNLTHRRFL